jgi:hypothetical protein
MRNPELDREWIGREILSEERASPNYAMREVRWRRSGDVHWEVVDVNSGVVVVSGFVQREEALRAVRAWERLNTRLPGGLSGHVTTH